MLYLCLYSDRCQWVWRQPLQPGVCQCLRLLPVLLSPWLPAEWHRWDNVWRYCWTSRCSATWRWPHVKSSLLTVNSLVLSAALRYRWVRSAHRRSCVFLPLLQRPRKFLLHLPTHGLHARPQWTHMPRSVGKPFGRVLALIYHATHTCKNWLY